MAADPDKIRALRERTRNNVEINIRFNGRSKRRKRLPQQVYPKVLERQYAKDLAALVRTAIREAFAPLLKELPGLLASAVKEREKLDGDRLDAGEGRRLRQLTQQVSASLQRAIRPEAVEQLATEFASRTATYQRRQLDRQVKAALGADVFISDRKLPALVDDFVAHNVSLITRIPARLHSKVEAMVMRSVNSGQMTDDLVEDIQEQFGIEERHARVIARDQAGKLYGDINQARQRELGTTRFIWRTVNDERVRGDPNGKYPKAETSHFELDGETFSWDDLPVNHKGERISPGSEIQCFPGDTPVSTFSAVEKVFRRRYRGEGTIIKTDQGRVLTSTPNHPVLTTRGWVAAHLVNVGDHVVDTTLQGIEFVVPDGEYREPMIQQIFELVGSLGSESLRVDGGGFHGDSTVDQEIDVIDVNRSLRFEGDLKLSQGFCQELLTRAYDPTLGLGVFDFVFDRLGDASDRFVRGGSQLLTILLGGLGHSDEHRLRAVSRLQTITNELGSNGCATDAEMFSKLLNTPPLSMEVCHHVARVIFGVVSRAINQASRLNSTSAEMFAERISAYTENGGHFCNGVGFEKLSRVVEKSFCELDCHVYNLQTKSGWYVAQNLIVHNCRCTAEPILTDILDELEGQDEPTSGDDGNDDEE